MTITKSTIPLSLLLMMAVSILPEARGQGGVTVEGADPSGVVAETPAQRDERMRWWREAKFGLFIHWGVYAVPEGRYGDQDWYGEWIMRHANIPRDVYREFAKKFAPTQYDPQAWARLAKAAGMRYMVITAKHHDGFALFPSEVTDWDIADASPYGKDLLGPLAEAARAEGLKFGLYYSQAMDWMHPGGGIVGQPWDESHQGDFDEYLNTIALPQVREILSRYQPDVIWWDTPVAMTRQRATPFFAELQKQPGILMNSRLGGGFGGDMQTPEQHIPILPPGGDWETCMTLNGHWGYNAADQNWKSVETLIHMLAEICGKGGNFLLNVGPTADGVIPQACMDRLEEVGHWLAVNGEAIYGTTAGPFPQLSWGTATRKGDRLYLHVFHWPEDGQLRVPLQSRATSAHLLTAPDTALSLTQEENRIVVTVPAQAPDPINSIVVLTLSEAPRSTPLPSLGKPVTASSSSPNHPAAYAVDGKVSTVWHPSNAEQNATAWLEIDLQEPTPLVGFGLGEPDRWPRFKQTFSIEMYQDDTWQQIAQGQTDGHGTRGFFDPVTAQRVRIQLTGTNGRSGLSELHLYSPE